MELDIKIVVLVALCVAMVQGREGDPGQSRRELLMKALNDLRSGRYDAMDRAHDYGARGYGPVPPKPMMKRYPAGPQYVNNAGRDYPPYYKRFPDGQPDSADPGTNSIPDDIVNDIDLSETESVEATTAASYEGEEEKTDTLGETLGNLQSDLLDIEAMIIDIMKKKCDHVPNVDGGTPQSGTGSKFGQLSTATDNDVHAAREAIATTSQIAELLLEIETCWRVNGDGEGNGETPGATEGSVTETNEEPVVATDELETEATEQETTTEATEQISDRDMEQLEKLLVKKLLEERVSALSKKGYPYGK